MLHHSRSVQLLTLFAQIIMTEPVKCPINFVNPTCLVLVRLDLLIVVC